MSEIKDPINDVSAHKLGFDYILFRDIGQFGRYQVKLMLLCMVVAVFNAWSSSEYLFTAARIPTRCLIPECDPEIPEFSPWWAYRAIPQDNGALDNCRRFAGNSSVAAVVVDTCPAHLFDQNTLQRCLEYVYANTYSIVYDFGLACDEWRRTLIGSMRTVGILLSLPVIGFISDQWGRRTALLFSAVNCAWLGIVRYWAGTYVGFLVSEVVEAILGSGIYTCGYILLIEVTAPKYRTAAGAIMSSFFAIGLMMLGLIAWYIPDWKNLTLALYVPQLLSVAYFWITSESARWYMSKGKYKEAEKVLQEVALTNKKTLSSETLEALRQSAAEQEKLRERMKQQDLKDPWLILIVFRHKRVLLRCVVAPVWWITNTLVYYGLSINAVNIAGNSYVNFMAVAAVEIPGFWTAVLLMNKIGRKPTLTGAYWMCAVCQLAYIFIPDDFYGVALAFFLLGKCSIAMVAMTLYIYTAELFPTKYRHTLFGFSSMLGRIGAIVAPLTPALGASTFEEIPFVLFGSFALVSGALMFLTPETLGTKLPDTMEEAENLGQNAAPS